MIKSLQIKDKDENILYPETISAFVLNDDTGTTVLEDLNGKQPKLVSGVNIKTINKTSLLGNGNINIPKGEDAYQPFKGWFDDVTTLNSLYPSPKVGDYAYVLGVNSVAIYRCLTSGVWSDSEDTFNPENNQEFASGLFLNEVHIIDNLESNNSNDVLSAKQGKMLSNVISQLEAIQSGTFELAWVKSLINELIFSWILVDTVNGKTIKKPIWHIGSSEFIDAAGAIVNIETDSAPSSPTIIINDSEVTEENVTVAKNTEISIVPLNGMLYYKVDNDEYTVSLEAVNLTLKDAGNFTISAYCVNSIGRSESISINVTVDGVITPKFNKPEGEVGRGENIIVTADGDLYYSIDEEEWSLSDGPLIVLIIRDTTISAYNVEGNLQSDTVTKTYTIALLDSPTFSTPSGNLNSGDDVTIYVSEGAFIKYTTDSTDPTSSVTATTVLDTLVAINITENTTIRAVAFDDYGYSEESTAEYTINTDSKFLYQIALTKDNSTEYVPVTGINAPKYTMTVDWGDGSTSTYNGTCASKGVGHTYEGSAGDTFTITLRGTAIPFLSFSLATSFNTLSLVGILENTLTCKTLLSVGTVSSNNLTNICANAFLNNTNKGNNTQRATILFGNNILAVPDGLLSNLTANNYNLLSCQLMFRGSKLTLTSEQVNELKSSITYVTDYSLMFYGFSGSVTIPDDFFDDVPDGTIKSLSNWSKSAGSGLNGDASKLYAVLVNKVTEDATVTGCFSGSGFTNRSQVPTSWGGTKSS